MYNGITISFKCYFGVPRVDGVKMCWVMEEND